MKRKTLRFTWLLALLTAALTGCGNQESSSESTSEAPPSTIVIEKVDHIDEPEDFQQRLKYVHEDANQQKKFDFNAKPGDSVGIANPSEDAISAEEIAKSVHVKNAFDMPEESSEPESGEVISVLRKKKSGYKTFKLYDPLTKSPISRIEPHGKALLQLDEQTKGGDLIIYEKDEALPINFDGKSSAVNQLIVATQREDVEEFDPNDETIKGLTFDKVLDVGNLYRSVEGTFVYAEATKLKEGDQFWIGDNDTFDESSTFFTFMSETPKDGGYLISYSAPDYSLCYEKLNIHLQDQPLNFDDPSTQFIQPTEEELIHDLEKEGGVLDIYQNEILPNLIRESSDVPIELKKAFTPSVNTTVMFGRATVNLNLAFSTEASSAITSGSIIISVMVKAGEGGSFLVRGGVNLYMKKTMSTYIDYSVRVFPYPKLSYVVAVKSTDEYMLTFSLGVAYSMKPESEYDIKKDVADQQKSLGDALKSAGAEEVVPPSENVVQGGQDNPPQAERPNVPGGALNRNPAIADDGGDVPVPEGGGGGGDDKSDTYTYSWPPNPDFKDKKYAGDGIVLALGGVHFTISGAVTLELGISAYFTPTLQGRFFFSYSKISTSVLCKAASGFSIPEGYSDDVEESRSTVTFGLYVQAGVEVGLIFEMLIYLTGTKAVFYVSASFTVGLYITLQGVAIVSWGDEVDTTLMGYLSIEVGLVLRASLKLIVLKGKIIVNIAFWEKKIPLAAFGTNLHFLDWADKREELEWVSGNTLNINDMGLLEMVYFSTQNFSVATSPYTWNYKAYFASFFKTFSLRLFDKLEIKDGGQYIGFDDEKGLFYVKDGAPASFDFTFKISINSWLGVACDDRTVTIHYTSSRIHFIGFEGYPEAPSVVDGVHLGGGTLEQGEIYQAPVLEPKEDGTPFYGWLGDNGLFLEGGEKMEVGTESITFKPVYLQPAYYTVNFYDGGNNLVASEKIVSGGKAVEPSASTRDALMEGKSFLCYDHDFDEVYAGINTYAIYADGDIGTLPTLTKPGMNIKSMYFDNVPETAIEASELNTSDIRLHVDYSNKTSAEFVVDDSWFSSLSAGTHEIILTFRGRVTMLSLTIA